MYKFDDEIVLHYTLATVSLLNKGSITIQLFQNSSHVKFFLLDNDNSSNLFNGSQEQRTHNASLLETFGR